MLLLEHGQVLFATEVEILLQENGIVLVLLVVKQRLEVLLIEVLG